jgi:hypothetical protein
VSSGVVFHWDNWGRYDWDYFAHNYEAMRRTVVEFRQVPWWNPWSCGGLPLAANPQLGLVSIQFILVLLFGTYPGLKLAVIVHQMIAAEGARWLAGDWVRQPWARVLVGFVYVANGALALHFAVGHLGVLVCAYLPWAVGMVFRLERARWWGVGLGTLMAVAVLNSLHYFTVYLQLICAALVLWRFWTCDWPARRRLLFASFAAGFTFLVLAGPRIVLSTELVLDFPRARSAQMEQVVGPARLLAMLVLPAQTMEFRPPAWVGDHWIGWHEFGAYVGLVGVVLFLVSLKDGFRWWHALAIVCVWLSLGNRRWYHPSWWITDLPILGTLRLATRWRVVAMLGVALGVGVTLANWWAAPRRVCRLLATVLAAILVVDLSWNVAPIYSGMFNDPPVRLERVRRDASVMQLANHESTGKAYSGMFARVRADYGVIYGYEPLIGHDHDPRSARVWQGHPDYRGEFWSDDGPVSLVRWSPNAIQLAAPPGSVVSINQNPGSYWLAGGRRIFHDLKSVDRHAAFAVRADESGHVHLSILPRSLCVGVCVSLIGVVGCLVLGLLPRGS